MHTADGGAGKVSVCGLDTQEAVLLGAHVCTRPNIAVSEYGFVRHCTVSFKLVLSSSTQVRFT
jgi:hypothetical protein